ncbi:hypothetical protein BH10ACI2_BH10ACI2_02920 [soil metagenome]
MNYLKTASRSSDLRKTNGRVSLVASFALAIFFAMCAIPPLASSAKIIDHPSAAPFSTPEPYFGVGWTAEATTAMDVVNGQTRSITSRHIVMAGTIIVRKLDNLPDPFGDQDNSPFNVTVTDDYDRIYTAPGYYPARGSCKEHHYWSIGDPNRYSDAPQKALFIYPFKLGDTWSMPDPLQDTWFLDHNFYYNNHIDSKNCGPEDFKLDKSGDQDFYAIPLESPSTDGFINGDANGNIFSATRHFKTIGGSFDLDYDVDWAFTTRRLIDRDLTVDRLEVTQGLQDKANSIPLVQGRRTVVRAYLGVGKEQKPIDNVTGELSVYSGGNLVGFVRPFNPGGRITARPSPDWLQINDTLNFEVPYPWTKMPSLRFEVEVNNPARIFETDYTNNKLSASLPAKDCNNGIDIEYVRIHFYPPEGNFGYSPDPNLNVGVAQEFMRKIYPIPEKGLKYSESPDIFWRQSLSNEAEGDALLSALNTGRLMSSSSGTGYIFGWLPRGPVPFLLGFSQLPGSAAWGQDGKFWRLTLAHEIGHNKGLVHDEGETTDGSHWFDVYERKITSPNFPEDLFAMMQPVVHDEENAYWISPKEYRFLMSKMCSGGVQAPQASTRSLTVNDNLILTGTLQNLAIATGTLDPLYRITTAPTDIPPVGTDYCVKLKNAAGSVLSQYCFDVSFEGEGTTPLPRVPFGMAVPYPAGLNQVELTKGTTVLSSRVASASPPAVTLTFPNASGLTLSGVQNITWNGSDPDGGTLTYSLLYSRDNGATWIGIGNGIVGNSYAVDFSSLPGGTSSLIKVMVSDGFRSAEDVSDNTFSVANKPPTAAIVSPPTGTSFPTNTKLTLQATGADLEDGSLVDAAFRWSSDRDGFLGIGQVLEVTLSAGNHIITMTAQDSGGLTSSSTINCVAVSPDLAASATISGRIVIPNGLGLKSASVSLINSSGIRTTVSTNSFGFYSFDNIRTGEVYTIAVSSKRYRFSPRQIQVNSDLTLSDFVGLE